MKEVKKRLKCDECDKVINAVNLCYDERFYCMNCGRNLGVHKIKQVAKGSKSE